MATDNDETSYRAYWKHVQDIAKEAKEAEKRGEDAGDYIHESVDGSWWVIYTHASMAALEHTTNEDAAFDEMGSDALAGCNSYAGVVQRLAFWALRADVNEAFAELPNDEEAEDDAEVAP